MPEAVKRVLLTERSKIKYRCSPLQSENYTTTVTVMFVRRRRTCIWVQTTRSFSYR